MIIRRSRRYTVKMADYESYSFGADVEMSTNDIGVSDADMLGMSDEEFQSTKVNLTELVLEELNNQLHDEIQDAITLTDNQKSYLLKAFGIRPTRKGK
jgi:hypothetical protein